MALVKCPKHKLTYNDANPRGCPACAQEREGGAAQVMQELARASSTKRPSNANLSVTDFDQPVTNQPRVPRPPTPRIEQLRALFRNQRIVAGGAIAIVVLVAALILSTRARFTSAESPAPYNGVVRPFPVVPNDPIGFVFSALGPQTSQPNPTARTLERYSYGSDLFIDGMNGLVYAVTLAVPNRSWRGLRVGMSQTNAEGALALLGTPKEGETPFNPRADTIAGYVVFRSLDQRPRRTLLAEVRPPNNCFDVMIDLQPRSLGVVTRRTQKWYAVASTNGTQDWVVTRIRAVSRSMAGPYSTGPVC